MDDLTLTSEPNAREADARVVREGLMAHNVARLGPANYTNVALFLRDGAGRVVGGLLGQRRWGWLYVAQLWVDDARRGRGAGSRLLAAAEAEARAAGCTDASLDTFSFQARPFYERHGYRVFGVLEGFPPGHRQFFMHKSLADAPAHR